MSTPSPPADPAGAADATEASGAAPTRPRYGLPGADWQEQLENISVLMRDLSSLSDPQQMVQRYGEGMRDVIPRDRMVSLSRRSESAPWYRITRSDMWAKVLDPWKQRDRLPRFDRGLLGDLLYHGGAQILSPIPLADDDPAAEYFEGMHSLMSIPSWDHGEALNMTVFMTREADAYLPSQLPEVVWMGNLFGRATKNLVLSRDLDAAYQQLDEELRIVAGIQRSLLPKVIPTVPGIDLAASYETSQHAGGDSYDFLELPDGRLGIMIADVCGHGTPAAVLMAITHSLTHTWSVDGDAPDALLSWLNHHIAARYTSGGVFVTAFFAIYDPATRTLTYSSAGHNPPRVRRCGTGEVIQLDAAQALPLGIMKEVAYPAAAISFQPGDEVMFYTDGITEARNAAGELYGEERLDAVVHACDATAQGLVESVLASVRKFTGDRPADDDRTLVVARFT